MTGPPQIVDLDTYEPEDSEIRAWYEMETSPEHLKWRYNDAWADRPTTIEEQIVGFRERLKEHRGTVHQLWAIDGGFVGATALTRLTGIDREHCAEVSYGVAVSHFRRGIGSQLLANAIQKARSLGLQRLEAGCFSENTASIALLRKLGFQDEGLRVGAVCKRGVLRDVRLFGLML